MEVKIEQIAFQRGKKRIHLMFDILDHLLSHVIRTSSESSLDFNLILCSLKYYSFSQWCICDFMNKLVRSFANPRIIFHELSFIY